MIVGGLGELLITVGVFLGLFVVWQLWWTSVEASAQATEIMDEFRHDLTPAKTEPAPEGLVTDEPPPVPDQVGYGETIGTLIVPEWYGLTNNAMPVVEGTGQDVLDQALAGHYEKSQQVGEVGNFALAGHRRTHGNSFRHVDELEKGDQIIVETADTWYVYEVMSEEIVTPDQVEVVAPVPHHPDQEPTDRLLTLTTCHSLTLGEYGNDHRWITYASFVGWMAREDGTPEQVLENGGA
ncbi:class E sortase [Isoptericola sp. BMS4]|uniref:class E sortase n=1 Tax=Isoptericola sp. BMS4 TaxID=2527875 RepID=UPI001F0FF2ED|nr:class E sortase [Isoptericola sp. BMS4]